jgi:anti-sigma factor RsiW
MSISMSHCDHIQQMLPDYHDGKLQDAEGQKVAEHLATCHACRVFDGEFRRAVVLLRDLPLPEPRLDMWPEFAPKMAEAEAQMQLDPAALARQWWHRAMGSFAEGLVLYTHVVAKRTLARMERYLTNDPFRAID